MAVVTLAELCRMDGMPSQPSVRRFVAARPDFPVLERGERGRSYRFDLDQALAFIAQHWRDGRHERRRRRLAAMPTDPQLSFLDGDAEDA